MKNWDHSIHQHVRKFECTKFELFCFIFVEVIKNFMGSVFWGAGGHPLFIYKLHSCICILFKKGSCVFACERLSVKY